MINVLRGLTVRARVLFTLCVMACGLFLIGPTHQADAATTASVRSDLPIALDGEVWAVEQVGPMVVVGGNFTQVQTSPGGPIVEQASIYAYDMDTGQFIDSFRPVVARTDGTTATVEAIIANADGTGAYIGGNFTNITNSSDGVRHWRQRIALLDVRTGDVDRTFAQGGVSATVVSLDLDQWGHLYVGGNFLNAYEFSPSRVSHTVRGLARFDAVTGEFDQGFRYEPHAEISLNDQPGVLDTALDPSGTVLFVAHRGGEFRDTITGAVFDSPGISRIELGANTHAATEYKLLVPDADDPLQEFYNDQTCNQRGVMIREIDVADDFIAVVHWGGDNGLNCDTTVRFPSAAGIHRADWVSRAFDSLFSVEIDDDVIYIGGHFRYLVNDTAPSAYPGESRANGGTGINIYQANPDIDETFRVDLVEPGYVYESFQLGALDAATGFGDPTFNPVSNAQLGVLEITAIDRGLLIGQDNNRVNNIETGRAAFFDDNPNVGKPQCSITLGNDGAPVLSWTDVGGVSEWQIVANGEVHGTAAGNATTYTDTAAAFGETSEFELRYERNDVPLTASCGSIFRPTPSFACSARLANDEAVVTWTGTPWDSVEISANGAVVATVDGEPATYTEPAAVGSTTYALRAFRGGDVYEASCAGEVVVVPGGAAACVATLADEQVTLSWSAPDATSQSIRRNGRWVQSVASDVTSFSETPGLGDFEYVIRVRANGQTTDIACDPSPITIGEGDPGALECTATLVGNEVRLSWTANNATTQSVRRNGRWEATVPGAFTTYSATPGNGEHAYVLRLRINGVNNDLACGEPITIGGNAEPVVISCMAEIVGGETVMTWNETGADTQVIRWNDRWIATVATDATSYTFGRTDGEYVLRLFTDGVRSDVPCELDVPEPGTVNRALNQPATQSSTHPANGLAERAVDGNFNASFRNGSVSLTEEEAQPWWQVDLGAVGSISNIELYERVNGCCLNDFANVVVFVSDTDMTGRSLADLEADPAVTSIGIDGQVTGSTTLSFDTDGRFVRVQLRGTNNLGIAEVVVYN